MNMATWEVRQGDCLELLRAIPDGSVDAVITDPPYSSGGQFRGDRARPTSDKYQQSDAIKFSDFSGDSRDQRSWIAWCAIWMGECRRIVKPGGMMIAFIDWRQLPSCTDAIQCAGWVWRGIAVWDKQHARPVAGRFRAQAEYLVWGTNGPHDIKPADDSVYLPGVFRCNAPPTAEREHSTQKPVAIMEQIVKIVPEGGTVLDPFAGSGTTGVACVGMSRSFIGLEMDSGYVEVSRRRIAAAERAKSELLTA